jgi:hypothetical protein
VIGRRLRAIATATLMVVPLLACVPAAHGAPTRVDVRATVHLLPGGGATMLQRGAFKGVPFGSGTASMRSTIGAGKGATFRFEFVTARGTVRGTGDVAVSFRGSTVAYDGTASITQGTGAFSAIRARRLHVGGSGPVTGETFTVRFTGQLERTAVGAR